MPPRPVFLRPATAVTAKVRTALALAALAAAFFIAMIVNHLP